MSNSGEILKSSRSLPISKTRRAFQIKPFKVRAFLKKTVPLAKFVHLHCFIMAQKAGQ